ncbi:MAG TPA: hypothetical protein VFV38_19490 [Ktedonobacteraceae bacterium]|nr:hypothetical protein [Ktedonobacteraceae bacterium]
MDSLAKTTVVQKSVLQHFCIKDGLIYVQTSPQRYVVKDVKTGRYFRLSNTIVRIMQCLDGTKSLATIGHELNIELEKVRYVVQQLAELRLLQDESPTLERPEQKQIGPYHWMTRIQRALLLRKDIITGDEWMERIARLLRLKYVFTPWFGLFLLIIYGVAISIYLYYGYAIQHTLTLLVRWNSNFFGYFALGWLFYCIIGILHELGHGFACKHFGGKVRAIGVALYFFRPAWYCDVTDAWLFTKRHERLITHAAGITMDFLLTSLVLFLLPFSLGIPWLMVIITLTFLVGGIRTLANFNPLIKLDGYYILADLLGIENMRQKSFYLLFSSIRGACYSLGLVRRPPGQRRFSQSRWERLFLSTYGLVSLGYTTLLLSYLARYYAGLLSSYIGIWSWLIFCFAIILFVLSPLCLWWYASGSRYNTYHGY